VTQGREFLERSLADLEAEHLAGDLSDRDYEELKARYERRLRGEPAPARPPVRRGHVAAAMAFVVVVGVAAGVLVARESGRRQPGDTVTGGVPTPSTEAAAPAPSLPDDLARCLGLDGSEAITCYTDYTEAHPDDPDGFTQFGAFAIQAGLASGGNQELYDAGEAFLRRALDLDPAATTARAYLAVLLNRTGRADEAATECGRLDADTLGPDLRPLYDLACT
jgi:cytochrome c-type biogenesis protein CcmH/NrfG